MCRVWNIEMYQSIVCCTQKRVELFHGPDSSLKAGDTVHLRTKQRGFMATVEHILRVTPRSWSITLSTREYSEQEYEQAGYPMPRRFAVQVTPAQIAQVRSNTEQGKVTMLSGLRFANDRICLGEQVLLLCPGKSVLGTAKQIRCAYGEIGVMFHSLMPSHEAVSTSLMAAAA